MGSRVSYDHDAARPYTVRARGVKPPSSNWSDIGCPFCGATVRAYHWSLFGGGKKCSCGAKHDGYGTTSPRIKKPRVRLQKPGAPIAKGGSL